VLEVPPVVRRKALAVGAGEWLNALPGLVEELAARWSLTVGRVFEDATEALVLDAGVGVLKLHIPGRGDVVREEITALELAGGDGCVALLRSDVDAARCCSSGSGARCTSSGCRSARATRSSSAPRCGCGGPRAGCRPARTRAAG
jgi:hypothetical protein